MRIDIETVHANSIATGFDIAKERDIGRVIDSVEDIEDGLRLLFDSGFVGHLFTVADKTQSSRPKPTRKLYFAKST